MKRLSKLALTLSAILFVCGCQENTSNSGSLLSVDFAKEKPLRYSIVTSRDVVLTLEDAKSSKNQKASETLDMVISYELEDVDSYGNSTIKATCESISSAKKSFSKKGARQSEPLESIKGRSWKFTINPFGQIQDYSGIDKLLKEIGAKSIKETGKRRIKGQDMIWDFVATQLYMWDVVASVDKPLAGVKPGKSWDSYLTIPFARVLPYERIVRYELAEESKETSQENPSQYLVINSEFTLAEQVKAEKGRVETNLAHLPQPYEGSYQMKGMFGFLRGYKVVALDGSGKTEFDVDRGVVVSNRQSYHADVVAGFLFPLGNSVPELTIDQVIEIQLLEDK